MQSFEFFEDAYQRWVNGQCPCCGGVIIAWDEDDPISIGEGVRVCGRCAGNGHMSIQIVDTGMSCQDGILQSILEGARVAAGHHNV